MGWISVIVVAFVARVTPSGQMDSTFGTHGVMFITQDVNAYFSTIASTATNQF